MLYYRTKEEVPAEELEQIRGIVNKYNAGYEWAHENIKLLREAGGTLWGFTKVNDSDRDGKLVIQVLIEKVAPRRRASSGFRRDSDLTSPRHGFESRQPHHSSRETNPSNGPSCQGSPGSGWLPDVRSKV